MPYFDLKLCDWSTFEAELKKSASPVVLFRDALTRAKEKLAFHFKQNTPVNDLVYSHVIFVDQLLKRAWMQYFDQNQSTVAMLAVGGYGRGELHPASDIDLLILTAIELESEDHSKIETMVTFLWDIGLDIGQSVRTVDQSVDHARNDITIATNIMEARHLCGPLELFIELEKNTGPNKIWPSNEFYKGKLAEQQQRHTRYGDTAYNLEPNIKENPGGLRDIQVIGWVAKRHFGVNTLEALVTKGFLTQREYDALLSGQNYLWQIRYGLHILSGRREDRLLFDYQREIAKQFNYQDDEHRLAVEQFMKTYYRTVMELNRLNEMLLQLFDEYILSSDSHPPPRKINNRFQIRNGFIEVANNHVFKDYPFALIEIFLISSQHQENKGFSAETIRLIRDHRHLIDDSFRNDVRCTSLFMEIFRQPIGLTHELRRMNRYGILAAYIPVFELIVGQMQHDLFHVYTVDEHTMFVIRNLRRLTIKEHENEFPLCSRLINSIPKPELLYLAGFFHDIAKGKGGDHSSLGAIDATKFCIQHGISAYDSNLVAWLVAHHLLMSTTAQRKDISDSNVISEFATVIGNQERLNYLYLLTVADIRGTSPTLWNSWKDSLLAELYFSTTRAFRFGVVSSNSDKELIDSKKSSALNQLKTLGFTLEEVQKHWTRLYTDYFLRYSIDEIIWHAQSIIPCVDSSVPLVMVREQTHRGGTELFIYTRDEKYVFAAVTASLENLGLTITDARITLSKHGYILDTFIVLEKDGEIISDYNRTQEIKQKLHATLNKSDLSKLHKSQSNQLLTRQQKHFPISPKISFTIDKPNNRTVMEVIAQDQPGLLAKIATAMVELDLKLQNAKIATFGEKAEDIFFITDNDDKPVEDNETQEELRRNLISVLSSINCDK